MKLVGGYGMRRQMVLRMALIILVITAGNVVKTDVVANNKYLAWMDKNIKMEKRDVNKNDYIERQLMHVRYVQDNMFLLEKNLDKLPFKIKDFELIKRGMLHDIDKLTDHIEEHFKVFRYSFYKRNGLEYPKDIDVKATKEHFDKHHNTNRHHFEYHILTNAPISNEDLCEIASDIYAVKIEKEEKIEDTLSFVSYLATKFSLKKSDVKKLLAVVKLLDNLYTNPIQ
jgi:hypothetical protein